jgi:hypothetical protein
MIRQRSPASLTEELFSDYISTVFILYGMAVRNQREFQNETAVLLMDSAIPRAFERVRRILGQNHMTAITFPVHTTKLFQALDLVFFGVLKKLSASATGEFDDDSVKQECLICAQPSKSQISCRNSSSTRF